MTNLSEGSSLQKPRCHLNRVFPQEHQQLLGCRHFCLCSYYLCLQNASSLFIRSVRPEKPGLLQDQERFGSFGSITHFFTSSEKGTLSCDMWADAIVQAISKDRVMAPIPILSTSSTKSADCQDKIDVGGKLLLQLCELTGYSWWYLPMKNTCQASCSSSTSLEGGAHFIRAPLRTPRT